MDAKLKERAEQVAQLSNSRTRFTQAQITEIGAVHYELTGRKVACTTCNVYGLINEVNQILIKEPLKINYKMATKGHFKTNAASTEIIRHTKNGTKVISPENLNEGDNFEWAAKNFPHLVEETKAAKTESAETAAKTESKTSAKK